MKSRIVLIILLAVFFFLLVGIAVLYRNGTFDLLSWQGTTKPVSISNLLVPQDSSDYHSTRGVYVATTPKGGWIWTKNGLEQISIPNDVQVACLPKEAENQWIDFSQSSDLERQAGRNPSTSKVASYTLLLEKQKTQIILSSPSRSDRQSVLWIIGCIKY